MALSNILQNCNVGNFSPSRWKHPKSQISINNGPYRKCKNNKFSRVLPKNHDNNVNTGQSNKLG